MDFAIYCIADICGGSVAFTVADLLNRGRPREHICFVALTPLGLGCGQRRRRGQPEWHEQRQRFV
jgi:hypothetical protein